MKNLLKITFSLFFVSVLFMGCAKKPNNTTKNYIKYDNKEYDLSQGYTFTVNFGAKQAHFADTTMGYSISLMLMSPGFTLHVTSNIADSVSILGTGSGITFSASSASQNRLEDGEYVFDSLSFGTPKTFNYSNAVFDYNLVTNVGTEVQINAGTFSVKTSGGDFEITFSCKTQGGKTVTGYYKGSLKSYIIRPSVIKEAQKGSGWNFLP